MSTMWFGICKHNSEGHVERTIKMTFNINEAIILLSFIIGIIVAIFTFIPEMILIFFALGVTSAILIPCKDIHIYTRKDNKNGHK